MKQSRDRCEIRRYFKSLIINSETGADLKNRRGHSEQHAEKKDECLAESRSARVRADVNHLGGE